ncbi:MAG: DUF1501 domain-containing protein [Deltaproteobacteria bacterium]|nr:DUF1501 domain-containing protein [Deltaproteobacteria bacterium]MDQ3296360.1 DUF1501 domain-containing protein [Myxococcota bacterium]
MNRRDLLKYTGAAGALALLAPRLGTAGGVRHATGTPRRLLMVMCQGGWDTTFAIDPKEQGPKVDVPAGTLKRYGSLDIHTNNAAGGWPSVDTFFTKYAPITAVVRGISVASVSHNECVTRMSTGTRDESNADMGAIVANDLGNDLPLPYLILGDTAFTGPYAVSAGRVGATNQIIALLDPAQAYPTGSATPFRPTGAEEAILAKFANASVTRARATRGSSGYNKRRLDDYLSGIERGKKLRTVRDGFGARGRTLTLGSQVDLALGALEQDVSQAVMLNTRLQWDTHDNNDADQAMFHQTTYAGLTRLIDQLATRPGRAAGTKMIDDTVVVCFSEFARTPRRNIRGGKDHWPVTSALVMGAGIRGGRAYGATTADIQGQPIGFATGNPSATGKTLTSQHFVGGVLAACGVDAGQHLADPEVFAPYRA